MNILLKIGTLLVIIALINYTMFILTLRRTARITRGIVITLIAGIIFDCTATGFMIAGSGNSPMTIHGIMGYTALGAMIADGILIYRAGRAGSPDRITSKALLRYSYTAYAWWVAVFTSGVVNALHSMR